MSRMIPSSIDCDVTKSSAERKLFERFKNEKNTENWTVLHSLFISKHVKQKYGEVDFVVITPDLGVYCLEVKGGRVKIQDGVTIYTNKYGETNKKKGTPFSQANDGMFSIKQFLEDKPDRPFIPEFGYGVMMPDIHFSNYSGIDHDDWRVYDITDSRQPLKRYIERLARYTYTNGRYNLSETNIKNLVQALRPNFVAPVILRETIDSQEKYLGEYTEEQFTALDILEDNKQTLFTGGAGTGKTVIALEKARRAASQGKRVLFICLSELLCNHLQYKISEFDHVLSENITVASLHSFFMNIADIDSSIKNHDSTAEYKENDLPIIASDYFLKSNKHKWDTLIIDEAQDILKENYLLALDVMLSGGLSEGEYAFFGDFTNQAIFDESITKDTAINTLSKWSRPSTAKFSKNCRNTKRISTAVYLISGLTDEPRDSGIEGERVTYNYYSDASEQLTKLTERIFYYTDKNVDANRITILTAQEKTTKSVLYGLKNIAGKDIINLHNNYNLLLNKKQIAFSTVRDYKGLENSIIIIMDIERIDTDFSRKILYTGMSRPRTRLELFINTEIKNQFQNLF